MNKHRILVTGGAGFIGSHVADLFLSQGHEVLVIDNLSTGKPEFISPQAAFKQIDITDEAAVSAAIQEFKPTVIDHHAAHILVGNSVAHPQFDAQNNIIGLLNIMQAGVAAGSVTKVIFAATGGAMYGNKQTPFTEEMKEQPLSPYGISKRSGELYLNFYHELYGIPFISLRYANVFGPRQNAHGESGVVAIFSEMLAAGKTPVINGDGTHTRDYVYVADVAQANLLALESDFVGELNIGTGREISTNQVFDAVCQKFGIQTEKTYGPDRPGEQVTSSLSANKAKSILNWAPSVTFEDGLTKVVEWYTHNS